MQDDTKQMIVWAIAIVLSVVAFTTCTVRVNHDNVELEKAQLESGVIRDPHGDMRKIEEIR